MNLNVTKEGIEKLKGNPKFLVTLRETITQLLEDTDLISLVAKGDTQKRSKAASEYLKKKGINSRIKDDSRFNPFDKEEEGGWGVFVSVKDVDAAAKLLKPYSKGLTFDPYVTTSHTSLRK